MNIVKNEKIIKRNAQIGRIASLIGILILVGGMYISFQNPDQIILAWGALIVGFGLSQLGIYFGNRWGRRPRPDELLDQALKGMDNKYTIYHYSTPASHLLVGPAGIWTLLPKQQGGRVIFEKGRWKHKGGSAVQRYLRLFAQEGLGRPDLEVEGDISSMRRFLEKNLPDKEFPETQAVLVFTNETVELDVEDAPTPSVSAKKLKEFIRKRSKEKTLTPEIYTQINELLS
jgi:hypothetical protein